MCYESNGFLLILNVRISFAIHYNGFSQTHSNLVLQYNHKNACDRTSLILFTTFAIYLFNYFVYFFDFIFYQQKTQKKAKCFL